MAMHTLTPEEYRQAWVNANNEASSKWAACINENRLHFSHHFEFRDGTLIYFVEDQYPRMIVRMLRRSYVFYKAKK